MLRNIRLQTMHHVLEQCAYNPCTCTVLGTHILWQPQVFGQLVCLIHQLLELLTKGKDFMSYALLLLLCRLHPSIMLSFLLGIFDADSNRITIYLHVCRCVHILSVLNEHTTQILAMCYVMYSTSQPVSIRVLNVLHLAGQVQDRLQSRTTPQPLESVKHIRTYITPIHTLCVYTHARILYGTSTNRGTHAH